jgi:hypothetical protein
MFYFGFRKLATKNRIFQKHNKNYKSSRQQEGKDVLKFYNFIISNILIIKYHNFSNHRSSGNDKATSTV